MGQTPLMAPPSEAAKSGPFHFDIRGMSDEAHFSAEQPGPQPPSRIPRADGRRQRPQGSGPSSGEGPQAPERLSVITKRSDFLAANRGKRVAMPGFVLLVHDRKDDDQQVRYGLTVSKKVGNAVVRNRMKRRFRELVRAILPDKGIAGADHILIGRQRGIERDFARLSDELTSALERIA